MTDIIRPTFPLSKDKNSGIKERSGENLLRNFTGEKHHSTRRFIKLAEKSEDERNDEESLKYFSTLVALCPDNFFYKIRKALYLSYNKKINEAKDLLNFLEENIHMLKDQNLDLEFRRIQATILNDNNFPDEALDACDKAITQVDNIDEIGNTNHLEFWRLKALAYQKKGDSQSALEYVNHILKYVPNDAESIFIKGELLFDLGSQEDEVLSYFHKAIMICEKGSYEYFQYMKVLADTYYDMGKYEDSLEISEFLILENPKDNEFVSYLFLLKLDCLAKLDREDEFFDYLKYIDTQEINTLNKLDKMLLTAKYLKSQSENSEKSDFSKIFSLIDDIKLLAKCYNETSSDKYDLKETYYLYIETLIDSKKYKFAIKECKRLFDINEDFNAMSLLATVYYLMDNYKESLYYYDKMLILDNDNKNLYLEKADCLINLGKKKETLDIYNFLLVENPHDIEILTDKLKLLYEMGDISSSDIVIDTILRVDPENLVALSYKFKLDLLKGWNENVIGYVEKLLDIIENIGDTLALSSFYSTLGIAYSHIGEIKKSLKYLNKSIEISKDPYKLKFAKIYGLINIGRYEQAEKLINKLNKISKSQKDGYIGLMALKCLMYEKQGLNNIAIQSYLQLNSMFPNEGLILNNLALLYSKTGEDSKATSLLNLALGLNNNNEIISSNLTNLILGNKSELKNIFIY